MLPEDELLGELRQLARVIRHDLREPLRAVQGFSRGVAERYGEVIGEEGQDRLRRVTNAALRLDTLVSELGIYLYARSLVPRIEAVEGDELIEDVLRSLRELCERTSARLEIAPKLPTLIVDRDWATRAISNLVANAIVFGAKEAPQVAISSLEGSAGLVVRDDGGGFPADPEPLFSLFRRGVGREVPGCGAGLAIARAVARRHGGDVRVMRTGPSGSEVAISFSSGAQACDDGERAGLHILLVEDNDDDVLQLRDILDNSGRVRECIRLADGEVAVAYLRRGTGYESAERPDLVMLDLGLRSWTASMSST
jgi:signal transduction histidine kinase